MCLFGGDLTQKNYGDDFRLGDNFIVARIGNSKFVLKPKFMLRAILMYMKLISLPSNSTEQVIVNKKSVCAQQQNVKDKITL